jgi:HK97 family phage prohead protease
VAKQRSDEAVVKSRLLDAEIEAKVSARRLEEMRKYPHLECWKPRVITRAQLREARFVRGRLECRFQDNDTKMALGDNTITLQGWAYRSNKWYPMQDNLGEWNEMVDPGAAKKTLSEKPRCNLLINHQGLPLSALGQGLSLEEVNDGPETGLWVDAEVDADRNDVRDLVSAIRSKAVTGLSFAFRAIRQSWDSEYKWRNLQEISLADGDVSFVGMSANPFTDGSAAAVSSKLPKKVPTALFDPTKVGASGLTETESATLSLEARLAIARSRARDRDRVGAEKRSKRAAPTYGSFRPF